MKSTWNYKLLQFLNNKKEDGGFTLIELLVVIIIIGILSAIALPAFLNQANRARQSEATTYVGSINRGQQAYRLENRTFADEIVLLGIGIQTTTDFYTYDDPVALTQASGTLSNNAFTKANPLDEALLGFTGIAYTLQDSAGNSTTTALLCKATTPGINSAPGLTMTGTAGSAPVITGCN